MPLSSQNARPNSEKCFEMSTFLALMFLWRMLAGQVESTEQGINKSNMYILSALFTVISSPSVSDPAEGEGPYPISPEPDYDIPMDDEPLDLNLDMGELSGFEGMPPLVDSDSDDEEEDSDDDEDSDEEEDSDDDYRDNERGLSEMDLPQDEEITRQAIFDAAERSQASSPTLPQSPINVSPPNSPTNQPSVSVGRENVENQLRQPVVVQSFKEHFPDSKAGEPKPKSAQKSTSFTTYGSKVQGSEANPYAPFTNRINWEIAKWAKLRGPSSTAFSELLNIDGVQEALGLSFKNSRELNKIIDEDLPGTLPKFRCRTTPVLGEPVDLYYRPIMECIQALLGNAEFTKFLVYSPERHYSDGNCTIRLYHDMHTGKWWWDTQVCISIFRYISK